MRWDDSTSAATFNTVEDNTTVQPVCARPPAKHRSLLILPKSMLPHATSVFGLTTGSLRRYWFDTPDSLRLKYVFRLYLRITHHNSNRGEILGGAGLLRIQETSLTHNLANACGHAGTLRRLGWAWRVWALLRSVTRHCTAPSLRRGGRCSKRSTHSC